VTRPADGGGRRPAAPEWFTTALAQAPERSFVAFDGVDLEVLAWGQRGLPGVLLLHGFSAHADWWSFIAPMLATGRRVVAFSFSGMGRSGWRDSYSLQAYAREVIAVAEAAGLFESDVAPIFIGHSFGSFPARIAARELQSKLAGMVLIDGALPADEHDHEYGDVPPKGHRHRIYPTLEQAVARFRYDPPQPAENEFITDHLARTSLGLTAAGPDTDGWSWRFDPDLMAKLAALPSRDLLAPAQCRIALMIGGRSKMMTPPRLALIRSHTPRDAPWIAIPDAGHHVMVDQPLALVAALRTLMECWQPAATFNSSPQASESAGAPA
jgi:pimeloyl-ACP methyl ester carboxylesterase